MTMESNAIVRIDEASALDHVRLLHNIVVQLKDTVFVKDMDFGVIPGTTKPTLLLPGMEKLMRALRLRPEYVLLTASEDFDKALFHYRYECRLVEIETGHCVATAIGSANSMETKWRWREAKRVCPACGTENIIKGKEEYGGGWLCFKKTGGCGAKYGDNDPQIMTQTVGRVENEAIFDQVNTIDKIAQKRALGSAIKTAANVSEFFTVDLEDLPRVGGDVVDAEFTEVKAPPQKIDKPATPKNTPSPAQTGATHNWTPAEIGAFVKWLAEVKITQKQAFEMLKINGFSNCPYTPAQARTLVSGDGDVFEGELSPESPISSDIKF